LSKLIVDLCAKCEIYEITKYVDYGLVGGRVTHTGEGNILLTSNIFNQSNVCITFKSLLCLLCFWPCRHRKPCGHYYHVSPISRSQSGSLPMSGVFRSFLEPKGEIPTKVGSTNVNC